MATARCKKNGRFMRKKEVDRRNLSSELRKSESKKRKAEAEPVLDVGRRIMDLSILANNMYCEVCDHTLHFKYFEKEVRRGLASIFHFRCPKCLEVTQVCSSNVVKNPDQGGYPIYSVNSKAALGCLDSGCGHEQFNHILTALNIPPISHHTLKLAERKIGTVMESTAQASCQVALLEEKALSMQQNDRNFK